MQRVRLHGLTCAHQLSVWVTMTAGRLGSLSRERIRRSCALRAHVARRRAGQGTLEG